MDVSKGDVLERVARVLAGQRISVNGNGSERSASAAVDGAWRDYREDALAVLRTLREPDEKMAAAGDPAIWERMICAALGDDRPVRVSPHVLREPPPPGTDPFHEGP